MLEHFSAAQPTSIHRRIMLTRGVIVPQRQTLRAVAFPAAIVGEAIHAPVADAERQLVLHQHQVGLVRGFLAGLETSGVAVFR